MSCYENNNNPFVASDYEERKEKKKEHLEERAEKAREKSDSLLKQAKDMAGGIPFGQPILVGHHSEKRDRRFRERIQTTFRKSFSESNKAEYYDKRAESMDYSGISSDDPKALEKLNSKLEKLVSQQDRMKATNKALKRKSSDDLKDLGFYEFQIEEIKKGEFSRKFGYPSYTLSNNNAEIRRVKKRIAELTALRTMKPLEYDCEDFRVFVEEGRIKIDFIRGKPSDEVRTTVKRYAFKWSRYNKAWVRKATSNAIHDARRLLESLKEIETIY